MGIMQYLMDVTSHVKHIENQSENIKRNHTSLFLGHSVQNHGSKTCNCGS